LVASNQLHHERDGIIKSVQNTFSHCGIEFSQALTEKMLETGKLHLLIDGLDELRQDNRNEVIGEIDSLTKQYRKCSFVITCRSSAYEFWFGDCEHYEIERFSKRAILYFIKR
jgi:predicted NACHT family NTPase